MRARIGLFVQEGRLTVVGITGRDRVEHFTLEAAEDPAAALAAELRARGLTGRRIRVGLDRRGAVVKAIDLPRAAGGDVAAMIGFELERHVPFPPEDVRFGWLELPARPTEPHRVLVAAVERRAVERPLALLAAARRLPALAVVACHELPALLARGLPPRRAVWAHRHAGGVDLLLLDGRTLLMSRQVSAADAGSLAREIQRSLPVARWRDYEAVWLSGTDAATWAPELATALGMAVSAPPFAPARAALVAALPAAEQGAGLLALAAAAAPRSPAVNLLPAGQRPWAPTRGQLATAAMITVTGLLGLALSLTQVVKSERHAGRLAEEIRRLDPEAKVVEGLAGELARKRAVLAAIEAAQDGWIEALPVLRELTETLPAGSWVQSLAMDRQGIELVGQSDAASTLIPLLEGLGRLERVEFTSPVTRTQDKEQFRIRASWESPAKP